MLTALGRNAVRLGALGLVLVAVWAPAAARADWTTYRGDAARSGVDTSSVGSLPFALAWTSPDLGGALWGQPLVHNGLVIVATESNQIWALSEATGQVVWQASAGTPVPSSGTGPHPPCGDISPTVGITSTPVVDPATNRVFVVADTLTGSTIDHKLFGFNLSDGSGVPGYPVDVEPPGDVPADQLQRPGLALDNGSIIIGYGGNDGDCGTYHGWLVSVPEAGGPARTFEVESQPGADEGAIWGSGNGPVVDSAGDVWVSTGNGSSGSSFGYQESVLKLDQGMNLLDHWAPSNWPTLDNNDTDLGSSAPLLLPNGLVFQIGKEGLGYLLSASNLGGTSGMPLYSASVCGGSWGGAVYSGGIIYVTCSTGLRALALNPSAPSFSSVAGWQVTSAANGPPTVAGGLVWATGWNNATLYGFNPQTGQPVVTQSTPAMEHFTTPSASDGKLFLATGQTVEAYTIANPASPTSAPPTSVAPPTTAPTTVPVVAAKCTLLLRTHRVKIHHPSKPNHRRHAPPAFGTVGLVATCSQRATVSLRGAVTEVQGKKPKHHKARTEAFRLAGVSATLEAGVTRTFQLRLSSTLLHALEHRVRETGTFTLTAVDGAGATRTSVHAQLRL